MLLPGDTYRCVTFYEYGRWQVGLGLREGVGRSMMDEMDRCITGRPLDYSDSEEQASKQASNTVIYARIGLS